MSALIIFLQLFNVQRCNGANASCGSCCFILLQFVFSVMTTCQVTSKVCCVETLRSFLLFSEYLKLMLSKLQSCLLFLLSSTCCTFLHDCLLLKCYIYFYLLGWIKICLEGSTNNQTMILLLKHVLNREVCECKMISYSCFDIKTEEWHTQSSCSFL